MKQESKAKALRRLKIIEGQVRGLQRMVSAEKYCLDIITQSEAVKEAISGVENVILENHLSTHVRHQMRTGQESKAIKELADLYALSNK